MANRTARHQQPGNRNLRGKRTKQVCPCCDPIIDHREKILAGLAEQEMRRAGAARACALAAVRLAR